MPIGPIPAATAVPAPPLDPLQQRPRYIDRGEAALGIGFGQCAGGHPFDHRMRTF